MGRKINALSGSIEAQKSGFTTNVKASGGAGGHRGTMLQYTAFASSTAATGTGTGYAHAGPHSTAPVTSFFQPAAASVPLVARNTAMPQAIHQHPPAVPHMPAVAPAAPVVDLTYDDPDFDVLCLGVLDAFEHRK